MCIIIINQKSKTIDDKTLKRCARINPHNLGIVWLDTFDVEYTKSSNWKKLKTDRPYIAHFRYATKGAINKDNTHPFICGSNKDELLMMNGTIAKYGNSQQCDSKVLADHLGNNVKRIHWKKELAQYDCSGSDFGSRLVLLCSNDRFKQRHQSVSLSEVNCKTLSCALASRR